MHSAHALTAELAAQGLTGSEMNALANLADGHGRAVSELASACGARPTTLTSVLDRLERRGLITRGSYPGDRRAVLIELTPPGTGWQKPSLRPSPPWNAAPWPGCRQRRSPHSTLSCTH